MKNQRSQRGAAPTLAIFLILVIVSSGLVIAHLQSTSERQVSSIQLLMASDITQAKLSSINSELNNTLASAATAAMDNVGAVGGSKEDVEDKIIEYVNNRIERGWNYPNLEIYIPKLGDNFENSFVWQPDGSLVILGYLNSRVKHVRGPAAYGTFINAAPAARFQRIKSVSERVTKQVKDKNMDEDECEEYEDELNENYECERLEIIIENWVAGVRDLYGGKNVIILD